MDIEERLRSAVKTGELLSVCYGGGSRPGEARDLKVLSFSLDSFRALETGAVRAKSYKVQKVLWIEDETGTLIEGLAPAIAVRKKLPDLPTLPEYESIVREHINTDVWALECDDVHLFAYGFFKNGKQRKTPSVWVSYNDPRFETIWDDETDEFRTVEREPTGKERPWRLDSKRFDHGKTKKHLQPIVEEFIYECNALAD